jgi:hypothetical protein
MNFELRSLVLNIVYTNLVDMFKDDRVIKRYSESFKIMILHELSQGKLTKNEIFSYQLILRFYGMFFIKVLIKTILNEMPGNR